MFKKVHNLPEKLRSLIFKEREIYIFSTVSIDEAKDKASKKKEGRRNLHLLMEGRKLFFFFVLFQRYKKKFNLI